MARGAALHAGDEAISTRQHSIVSPAQGRGTMTRRRVFSQFALMLLRNSLFAFPQRRFDIRDMALAMVSPIRTETFHLGFYFG